MRKLLQTRICLCLSYNKVMSEPTLIQDSSLPYKEKLVAGGYVKRSQLPPSRDDSDWSLLLNVVLLPPELIELKNALFPKADGKTKHNMFILHRSSRGRSSFIIHRSSPCFCLFIFILYFHMLLIMRCFLLRLFSYFSQ